ncbi:MAG: hypothetical protein ACRDJN_24460 [Chloroflexota bacterium]
MARLNISIPDPLYERLDRQRDRINASKVCAAALEKELDMVEGQTLVSDVDRSKVERLVERLQRHQTERDRWYRQGRQDGETWAMETAALDDLRKVEKLWDEAITEGEADYNKGDVESWESELSDCVGVDLDQALSKWEGHEAVRRNWTLKRAYLRGWQLSVHELWTQARPQLH